MADTPVVTQVAEKVTVPEVTTVQAQENENKDFQDVAAQIPEGKKEEDEKTAPEMKVTGEEDKTKDKGEEEPAADTVLAQKDDEVRELRQMLRDQTRELTSVKSDLSTTKETLRKAIPEAEDADEVAAQQSDAKAQAEVRVQQLDTLLETMRINPKYEDIDEIVSQAHFDDVCEAMAKEYVAQNGGQYNQVIADVEKFVWSLPNPYRFMYDKIKDEHPDFVKKPATPPAEAEVSSPARSVDTPPDIASTVVNIPGGESVQSGWTAARIDALPEDNILDVPSEVYNLYLQGKLK